MNNDNFYINEDAFVYRTRPLKEFSLELMLGNSLVNEENYKIRIILDSLIFEIVTYGHFNFNIFLGSTKLNKISLRDYSYIYLIYENNKLYGYSIDPYYKFDKSKAAEIFSINTSLNISQIEFEHPNLQCLALLRLSNKANDLYYAK